METIRLSNRDFSHLVEVSKINKEYKKNYPPKIEALAKQHISDAKAKLYELMTLLKNDKYLSSKFHFGISRIRKQAKKGGGSGPYRENLWIWLVDKNQLSKLRGKIDTPQIHLPQIQISIGVDNFTTAEIWFENRVLREWTEHLSNKLLSGKFNNFDAGYFLWSDEEKKWILNEGEGNKKVINKFVDLVNNNHKLKGGIGYVYDSKEITSKKSLYKFIKKDLSKIIDNYYKSIIGFTKLASKKRLVKKLRNRKESKINTVKKIFRKGTEGGEVSQKHKSMQRKYVKHLIGVYGKNNVKPEQDFVDIRVNDKKTVYIYELKTDNSAYKCIRQAMGQLLFYSWRVKNTEPDVKKIKLIVMGINDLETNIQEFYDFVKNSINMEIEYIKFPFKI